ncbi:MAG: cation:proton antiporter [Candidatus Omnitrophota bacterium]|nr:cation:proton antiporter [Candidatus Omnitrophota bacterium]MDZ4241880.1 cation:proton antiporter [Candidatus Omnitrophota bacterium]
MKNIGRNIIFYVIVISAFTVLLWFTLQQGRALETGRVLSAASEASSPAHLLSHLSRNLHHPFAMLILQVLCIMAMAKIFGFLMVKIGQPTVIGEILAGIILGPSLLGSLFPGFSAFLFASESLPRLQALSQIGLVLFMFIVGMELNVTVLKEKAPSAVVISHTSIVTAFLFGAGLAYVLYPDHAPPQVPFLHFALFMGIGMSIAAFAVLARIVREKNLNQTALGPVAITCAASDDITGWCLLALVIAIVSAGGVAGALATIALAAVYVAFMLFVVRPFLNRFSAIHDTEESVSKMVVAVIFGILLLSALLTETIGIYALFGSFIAGVIIPPQKAFRQILAEKIEDVSLVLLLPIFFVFTGLRTQVGLLNSPHLWGLCLLIIATAVTGKFLGSALAARFLGLKWRDSLILGALLNTRGLMELITLNIGYDLGILSPEIFTMMVLMALVTGCLTSPAISLIDFLFKTKEQAPEQSMPGFHALISFGSPRTGGRLLDLAHGLGLKNEKDSGITAIHISSNTDLSVIEAEQAEQEVFAPIREAAAELGMPLRVQFRLSDKVEEEIANSVEQGRFDMVLVGSSRPLFMDDKTGGRVRGLIESVDASVGVFIDKGAKKFQNLLMVFGPEKDAFLLKYGPRFLSGAKDVLLTCLDERKVLPPQAAYQTLLNDEKFKERVLRVETAADPKQFFGRHDLVVISYAYWKGLRKKQDAWLKNTPSVLIISR